MTMLTRRAALRATLAGSAALVWAAPLLARAATLADRRFVFVILRGGMDGLAAVPPYADPDYATLRGELAGGTPGTEKGPFDLDGRFGLHPQLKALHGFYAKGEALIVHAAAAPYRERSHFDAQDLLENGTERPHGADSGWINRALALLGGNRRLGLAIGQSIPLAMRGKVPVASWAPSHLDGADSDFVQRVAALYGADPALGPAIREGLAAQGMSAAVLGGEGGMAGKRGAQSVRALAEAAGKLLAAPDGARVAMLELGGWDTHAGQQGRLALALGMLDDGLAALAQALGPAWRGTAVVVATEFGRTAAINGTGGTDHGTAGAAFLVGGAVRGGRVVANWPGLAKSKLHQGRDLAPTTDVRALFKGVLRDHLGLPAADLARAVFPGSEKVGPLEDLIRT
jgi:uncharacterized protein (DUF1501 family)